MQRLETSRWLAWIAILYGSAVILAVFLDAIRCLPFLQYEQTQGIVMSSAADLPEFHYRFEANDRHYSGQRFSPSLLDAMWIGSWSRDFFEYRSRGSSCPVYFDPDNPEHCSIVATPTLTTVAVWMIAALLGSVLAFGGRVSLRNRQVRSGDLRLAVRYDN